MNAPLMQKQVESITQTTPAEQTLYKQLAAMPLREYREAAAAGRVNIPRPLREAFKDINQSASLVLKEDPSHEVATFAKAITEGETLLLGLDKPRYICYSNLPVLEWYLGSERSLPLEEHRTRAWRAFSVLTSDLCEWHNRRATALVADNNTSDQFRVDRAEKLENLKNLIPAQNRPLFMMEPDNQLPHLAQYINDPDATLRDLSAFPQSTVPDEYMFLRAIHLAEVGFWGASAHIRRALERLEQGERGADITETLKQGEEFTRTLAPIMQVVHSMLTDTFASFRDATGNASAVQSARYQFMEAQLYGVLPEKRGVLEKIPEARAALEWHDAGNRPLVSYVDELRAQGHEDIATTISELEKHAFGWRQYHKRRLAAGGYLPPEAMGTGLTSGLAYLESHKPPRPQKP